VARVSPNFFSTLGVEPQLGRTFTEEEGRPEGPPVVMISDSMWRNHFGGDHNIVGKIVTLDTTPHTVVGVLPADVQFPFVGETDIWTPRHRAARQLPARATCDEGGSHGSTEGELKSESEKMCGTY
jgi:hypothetical protein